MEAQEPKSKLTDPKQTRDICCSQAPEASRKSGLGRLPEKPSVCCDCISSISCADTLISAPPSLLQYLKTKWMQKQTVDPISKLVFMKAGLSHKYLMDQDNLILFNTVNICLLESVPFLLPKVEENTLCKPWENKNYFHKPCHMLQTTLSMSKLI